MKVITKMKTEKVSDLDFSQAKIKIVLALKSQESYAFYWLSLLHLNKPKHHIFSVSISIDLVSSMESLFSDWEKYDAILITEWDHKFNKNSLEKLWNDKKPVICGLYRSRNDPNLNWLVALENPYRLIKNFPEDKIFCVDTTGTGFMLLRKEALSKLMKTKKPFAFYKRGLDRYLCKKLRKLGFNIWIDPKIKVGHYLKRII